MASFMIDIKAKNYFIFWLLHTIINFRSRICCRMGQKDLQSQVKIEATAAAGLLWLYVELIVYIGDVAQR